MARKVDPVAKLQALVDASTIAEVAEAIGVSAPYVSAVLAGNRPPSDKILTYLKLERIVYPDEFRELA